MAGDLFEDLPPPSASPNTGTAGTSSSSAAATAASVEASPAAPPPPKPALKSALKRPKPPQDTPPETSASGKRLRFKMTTDASETQVIEAMQKISSHIKNLSKFGKASKLAIQLIEAGSVKPSTSDHFFAILEAAMSSSTTCNEPSVRADYHALFSASQDVVECLSKKQQNSLAVWTIRAVVANDLFTDDSFVFSKATGKVKEGISNLPIATKDDDIEEAAALEDEMPPANVNGQTNKGEPPCPENEINNKEEQDPFGLDALIPSTSKKEDKAKAVKEKKEPDEAKRLLKSKREAWISCLEIAAKRYKTPWCQTGIDILVKHAFDNISRFTSKQREAIKKLWVSVREQQVRRKQGKSVSGKLDVNGFELLQQKYANEKISIRHSVGGSGDRRCTQWLG
ncbi:PREDICTED: uncharacterized protein LOC109186887 [Ipomoea nil]|uniref:uncharacterized protein LOC109186887 n=1 Tax=Ipomoea nil TaxID=35883 RepID=UPI000901FAD6|nr:PREDICTED: uncharacterized protein LOC109186887 [Ipomoea nil]XP_019192615.1 PREDICTED: uncharacterized protein LOC109186887 [Ipomoea nil]